MMVIMDLPFDLPLASPIQPEIMDKYTSWARDSCFSPSMEKKRCRTMGDWDPSAYHQWLNKAIDEAVEKFSPFQDGRKEGGCFNIRGTNWDIRIRYCLNDTRVFWSRHIHNWGRVWCVIKGYERGTSLVNPTSRNEEWIFPIRTPFKVLVKTGPKSLYRSLGHRIRRVASRVMRAPRFG